jgi:DNA-binding transcriptional regulator YiaG
MPTDKFRDILAHVDLSMAEFARITGYAARTVRGWGIGQTKVPHTVAVLIELLRRGELTAEQVKMARKRLDRAA